MNNELNYSNQDLVNTEIADFNKAVTVSYNARLLKILSNAAIVTVAITSHILEHCSTRSP